MTTQQQNPKLEYDYGYTQSSREMQNRIARAILTNDTIKEPVEMLLPPSLNPRQLPADDLAGGLDAIGTRLWRVNRFMSAAMARGDEAETKRLHLESQDLEKRWSTLEKLANKRRNAGRKGTYRGESSRYRIDDRFFELEIFCGENGFEIQNTKEYGQLARVEAWKDLARWVEAYETGQFRAGVDPESPVWRLNMGILRLRSYFAENYPGVPEALSALELSLRRF